tara:strand:- start:283 stop:831 length:549 start_codon:yes stop_codon:yes gene_type:complete
MQRTWNVAVWLVVFSMFVGNVLASEVLYAGGPPQPYYADYVMGQIVVPDGVTNDNLRIAACISGCQVYETDHAPIDEDGRYKLALHPEDRRLAGRTAIVYLLNDYGKVRANETVVFSGGFKTHQLDLTFNEALPVPPDLPVLPMVGDEIIPLLPKYAIVLGISAILVSLVLSRRRFTRGSIF